MTRLSIVLTGRNDGHGGKFSERLFAAAEHNVAQLEARGISFEYVWVEWNAPQDRPLLAEELVRRLPHCRAYVAGPEIHEAYCENPQMPMMEFIAKNAGIRRVAGDLILTTNADLVLSDAVIDALARMPAAPGPVVYRAVRHDLRPGVRPDQAGDPQHWQFSHATTPPYHIEGSGDFLLADAATYHALRGFNETIRYAKLHKDSQFCIHAYELGFAIEVIGEVYHLYHPNSWMSLPVAERVSPEAPWGPVYNYRENLPYLNPPDWGLQAYDCEPIAERISRLVQRPAADDTRCGLDLAESNVLAEAEHAWQFARHASREEFRGEYVTGLGRLLRHRPDRSSPAVAFLRRYVQALWQGLLADPAVRERGVALYGAGRHTEWLLNVVRDIQGPHIRAILDDSVATGQTLCDLPILRPAELDATTIGAIVTSSDLHEERMEQSCRRVFGPAVRVVRLYTDLPIGMYLRDCSAWDRQQ